MLKSFVYPNPESMALNPPVCLYSLLLLAIPESSFLLIQPKHNNKVNTMIVISLPRLIILFCPFTLDAPSLRTSLLRSAPFSHPLGVLKRRR